MRIRYLALLMAAVGVITAYSSSDKSTPTPAAPVATTAAAATAAATATATTDSAMMEQPGAQGMKISITSPANGATITANDVTLEVAVTGYTDTCDGAGTAVVEGHGHYHVLVDKSLVDMFCKPTGSISFQNLKPGEHTITVVPAQNDHHEIEANASSVTVNWQPTAAPAELTDTSFPGAPSITIVSPKAGDTISGAFDVTVEVKNFNLSCDLYGRADVIAYGHWHLNFDTNAGPMMGMVTMVGMSCEQTFHATTTGLTPGAHTLIATLMGTGHAPIQPEVASKVEVTVK